MAIFHSYVSLPEGIDKPLNRYWLVVYLPRKMMEFVSWDDDIPNWMESHKWCFPNISHSILWCSCLCCLISHVCMIPFFHILVFVGYFPYIPVIKVTKDRPIWYFYIPFLYFHLFWSLEHILLYSNYVGKTIYNIYHLVICYIAMERFTMLIGKPSHHFNRCGAMFTIPKWAIYRSGRSEESAHRVRDNLKEAMTHKKRKSMEKWWLHGISWDKHQ